MVSLGVLVAAGAQDAARRALTEEQFEARVLWRLGLPLPPVAVHGDAGLPDGGVVVSVNGEPGAVETGGLIDHLWRTVTRRGADLVDDRATRCLLDLLHEVQPDLVQAACVRFEVGFIRRRLQAFLAEGLPITDLRGLLEALLLVRGLQAVPPGADEAALALSEAGYDRELRAGMRHLISSWHARAGGLDVHLVHEGWRGALRSPLTPADRAALQAAVAAAVGGHREAVLLTDDLTRVTLRDLLRGDWPGLTVLAFGDLAPDMHIRPQSPVEKPPPGRGSG